MSRVLTLPTVGTQTAGSILGTMPGIRPILDPGLAVILSKATAWYSARDLTSTTQQSLPNRVNPPADPAQFGPTTGEDTNDPERVPYDLGKTFVHSYGDADSGNRIEMRNTHRVDPTENYLRLSAHLRDYPDNEVVYNQCSAIGASSGRLQLGVSKTGQIMASARTVSATSQAGYSDPIPGWEPGRWVFIRGVWEGAGWSFFYKFNEADTWATVDADQTGSADSLNPNLSSANIQFGHQNVVGTRPTVDVAWAEVHQEAGTVEFNPSRDWDGESPTFVDVTSGGTIEVTEGSDNVPFLVTAPSILFDGTDDLLTFPDLGLSFDGASGESATLICVVNPHGDAAVNKRLIAFGGSSGGDTTGPIMHVGSTDRVWAGGRVASTWADASNATVADMDAPFGAAMILDGDTQTHFIRVLQAGAEATGLVRDYDFDFGPDSSGVFGQDASPGGTNEFDGSVYELVIVEEALGAKETFDVLAFLLDGLEEAA